MSTLECPSLHSSWETDTRAESGSGQQKDVSCSAPRPDHTIRWCPTLMVKPFQLSIVSQKPDQTRERETRESRRASCSVSVRTQGHSKASAQLVLLLHTTSALPTGNCSTKTKGEGGSQLTPCLPTPSSILSTVACEATANSPAPVLRLATISPCQHTPYCTLYPVLRPLSSFSPAPQLGEVRDPYC